jgi:hypothetical protein
MCIFVIVGVLDLLEVLTTLDLVKNGILNPSARISNLRAQGINILCEKIDHVNKFSRKINYGMFTIINRKDARLIYSKIN